MNRFKAVALLGSALLAVACAGGNKTTAVNAVPASYAKQVAAADKSCQTDADCAAVKKGCCMCQGYESVNKKAAEKLQKKWENECALAACTMQMCYVEITPVCQNHVCTGTPKPMDSYFSK